MTAVVAWQLRELAEVARTAARAARPIVAGGRQRSRGLRARPRQIADYFRSHEIRKLQLGCGPISLAGWLNADLRPRRPEQIFVDVRERLPFAEASVDYVFSEHMIGDLTYAQTRDLLGECRRVLRPGGRLRLVTPSLLRLSELYVNDEQGLRSRYVQWSATQSEHWRGVPLPGFVINTMFQEYRFVYDPATLRRLLAEAGFDGIAEVPYGESVDPQLRGIDSHGRVIGDPELSGFESLTMEAVRP